ncbi:MAG: response regulator [Isosphaeraceae bacterium]|nr:response regulator [Isosphaeraceae bacterium]
MARAFAACVREALQPLSLGVAFGGAVVATALLRIPHAGFGLLAALVAVGAWGFQGLVRQSGSEAPGPHGEGSPIPLWRDVAVRLLLSVLGAVVVLAPFVVRNGGVLVPGRRTLGGAWVLPLTLAAWWVVAPLVFATANARDRRGPVALRRVLATFLARPRGTLAALLVVPAGLLVVELALALITIEQGHFPLLLNNVFPTPTTDYKTKTLHLVYRYDNCVWNEPFTDAGLNLVPVYLSGVRRGFTFLGEVPASLTEDYVRFAPSIYQTQAVVFLALRFVLTVLGFTAAASVLGVQARCLGRLVAAGVEAEIAASARTGLVVRPLVAGVAATDSAAPSASSRTGLIPIPPTPASTSQSASARTGLIPIPPTPASTPQSASSRTGLIPIPPTPASTPQSASARTGLIPIPARPDVPIKSSSDQHPSVLIIDDELPFAQVLGRILSDEGFTVSIAVNARDGLQLAAASQPDLIILDVLLPDRSGLEVCRALRAQDTTRAVPILMLSYRGGTADEVSGLEQGADDYVAKPYVVEVLIARIRKQLRFGKSRSAAVRPEGRALENGAAAVRTES